MSFDFQNFGNTVAEMVIAHSGHGGWYETPDGLRCRQDDEIVCPSPAFLGVEAQGIACISCPRCGMTSYHPDDIREKYCGNCHEYMEPGEVSVATTDPRPETTEPNAELERGYFTCPNDDVMDKRRHEVKWNGGDPWCLTCDVAAIWTPPSDGSEAAQAKPTPTPEFIVEGIFVVTGRGPCVTRSLEAAKRWPSGELHGPGEPGCFNAGDQIECGELRATIQGLEYFAIPGPQPQQSMLLSGVEREQLEVGQVWRRAPDDSSGGQSDG